MADLVFAGSGIAPVRGRPPARTPAELAALLRSAGGQAELLAATGTWLVSGRRESAATRSAYVRDVGWWVAWCGHFGTDPFSARARAADLYVAALRDSGLARATVGRRLAAVSSWYRYLAREEIVAANPFEGMDRPRVETRHSMTRGLSRDQVAAILDHAARRETTRTCAMLWLMFATAGRVNSVITARVEALGTDAGHQVIDLHVKGDEVKRFVLPPAALSAIRRHLSCSGDPSSGPMFTTRSGRCLDQPYVWRLVNRVAAAAGVPHKISPHSFRHAAITMALGDRIPLHIVQDFAGHADPRTTRRYDQDRDALDRSPAYRLGAAVT